MIELKTVFGKKGLLSATLDGYEHRPGQLQMAQMVAQSLENDEILLYEAPTGTGKTLAYLIPAIGFEHKVVISTGTKALQEQILYKDMPLAEKVLGVQVRKAVMKGRQNYLCKIRLRNFLSQPMFKTIKDSKYFDTISKWSENTVIGDRDELADFPDDFSAWNEINSSSAFCMGQRCSKYRDCFVTKMRQRAQEADIIIVNHHLFFADLEVRGSGHGEVIPRYHALILDEAHQLEDVATSFFGISVSTYRIEELARDIAGAMTINKITDPKVANKIRVMREIGQRFFDIFFNKPDDKFRLKEHMITPDVIESRDLLIRIIQSMAQAISDIRPEKGAEDFAALEDRCDLIANELDMVLDLENKNDVHWCETRKRGGVFLHGSPIELKGPISDMIFSAAPSITLCSATLATGESFDFLKSRLGITREVLEEIGPPCFDYRTQGVLYVPRDFPLPNDPGFVDAVAAEMQIIINASRGRAFCLFTSYKNMHAVYDLLEPVLPYTCMLQGKGSKTALLNQFRSDEHSVLFATASFWEGVDVVGSALSAVLIDKIPFASPGDPITEARIEALKQNQGNPFMEYQLPQASISLKQGLGRLIRHRLDKGVMAVFDARLRTKHYGKTIINGLPDFPVTSKIEDVARYLAGINGNRD